VTDPRFPKRPDSADFWLLSQVVIDNDTAMDNETIDFDDRLAQVIEPDAVAYMAQQRALRIVGPSATKLQLAKVASIWLDAFIAGATFQARKDRGGQQVPNSPEETD
jgi:hypothetical protein